MNICFFEAFHGRVPDCNRECGDCEYFSRDEVNCIMEQWKTEAGLTSPVLYKYDYENNKLIIYTTRPGLMIGPAGNLFYKYRQLLYPRLSFRFSKPDPDNVIEFIECNDYV